MTIASPQSFTGPRHRIRSTDLGALKELPPRRPEPPATSGAAIQWVRVDLDRYAVSNDGRIVGFIDVVGAVFVALSGHRYDQATELMQTLDFAQAVDALCTSSRR